MPKNFSNLTVGWGDLVLNKDDLKKPSEELDFNPPLITKTITKLTKKIEPCLDDYSISESDTNSFENDLFELELEPWLFFNSTFGIMHSIVSLRFKLMCYFINMLKNPSRESTKQEKVKAFFNFNYYNYFIGAFKVS